MADENAPIQLTPDQAWQRLAEGNARFVAGASAHPNQDAARRESLTEGQAPFAAIFGCSDSRLAAEIIFDLGLGDTFVVRTAGQVLGGASLGSLEYAVAELNVPLIVVLGHDSCGAVGATKQAAETGQMPPGFVRDLVEAIMPSVIASRHGAEEGSVGVNDMVREHTRQSAARLVDQSKIITEAVEEGRTAVLGVFYNLRDGKAELVSSSRGL
ncbi:carbonic anhydrase [Rothia sp. AR01]|uniref:Carbonic anhydrase n=1 Tax=Rothia santali TaxID=2949643 RepID=A0A9X2HET7_9MICC|nr:carbonic anhydrase [Rothia santali]MCP3426785.1 carbonic anhydrase [Rothia santali]